MKQRAAPAPVFVSGDTAAALCEVSRDTWDTWVRLGYVPRPCVDRGNILRWHWPTVEAALAGAAAEADDDPLMKGVQNVRSNQKDRRRAAA